MPARKNAANSSVPPPPPADLAARCRATIPVAADADFGRPRKPVRRRLLTAAVGAAMIAALAVVELARPSRTPDAIPSPNNGVAFAETVRAMQRVTFFHRTGTGLDAETIPQWKYLAAKFKVEEWFDAQRGLYSQSQHPAGPIQDVRLLRLPNNRLYIRSNSTFLIETYLQSLPWSEVKKNKIRGITDPSAFGYGVGSPASSTAPVAPSASGNALWQGKRVLYYTFIAPPVRHEINLRLNAAQRAVKREVRDLVVPRDTPTLRSEVYADPETRRVLVVKEYARLPAPSVQPELLIGEWTYDYDHRPDDAFFSPSTITKGAKQVKDFREMGVKRPAVAPPPPR